MLLYRYLEEGTSRFAITRDVGGQRLPITGAVWLFAGRAKLHAQKLDPATVKAAILAKGYFLWPDDWPQSDR